MLKGICEPLLKPPALIGTGLKQKIEQFVPWHHVAQLGFASPTEPEVDAVRDDLRVPGRVNHVLVLTATEPPDPGIPERHLLQSSVHLKGNAPGAVFVPE